MSDRTLTSHLDFLLKQSGQDETTLLALALRTGIETLYREAMTEAYLLGKVPRETVVDELGPERLGEIEYQRDILRHDVEWGLKGA